MPDEARIALSCRNNQKSWDGIHTVTQTLAPLKDPVEGGRHTVRQRRFNTRMYVDKVDGAWTCGGENAEVVTLCKQSVERTESILPRVVATGDICFDAEPWF